MQGQLTGEPVTVEIETACKHCGQLLHIELDSNLNYRIAEKDAKPLVFMPDIDWQSFREPNIIHAY